MNASGDRKVSIRKRPGAVAGVVSWPLDLASVGDGSDIATFDAVSFTFPDGYAATAATGTEADRRALRGILAALARGLRDPATMRSEAMRARPAAEACGPGARQGATDALRKIGALPKGRFAVALWRHPD